MSSKDSMYEAREREFETRLASVLGITYDELSELDYEIHEETGSSGEGAYGYYVEFSDKSPTMILKKIKNLEGGRHVRFAPYEPPFDGPDE